MTRPAVINPGDRYPKPPYKKQSQPWPGLASKMDPRPDHGEESYRGSGRLAGRKALITGGDSGMGRAANNSRHGLAIQRAQRADRAARAAHPECPTLKTSPLLRSAGPVRTLLAHGGPFLLQATAER